MVLCESVNNIEQIKLFFKKISFEMRKEISREKEPLLLALIILAIVENKFEGQYSSAEEISCYLEQIGIALEPLSITRSFSRAGKKISRNKIEGIQKYRIMLSGIEEVNQIISLEGQEIIHLEEGKSFSNRVQINSILSRLQGDILILDTYFGSRTFSLVSQMTQATSIRLLTARYNENKNNLISLYKDYQKEISNLEIRIYPKPTELHDRYLISKDELIILGHGLKDIGSKESFLVVFDKSGYPDLYISLMDSFNLRWKNSPAFS